MNQYLTIKNDSLLQDFLSHLQLADNNDIILSAPFGTGKTYFLKEDFTPKTEEQYNVIHLFPVNYSVASNEDIFELIKYDILFEIMLKFNDQLTKSEDIQIGKSLAIQMYLQNEFKPVDFFLQMLKTSGKIGKSVGEFVDLLKQEKGKFDEFSNSLEANEYDVIQKYLESFEKEAGAKEFDAVSALISDVLVKVKGDEKQNILIIDDLDRIDPEHIFRIFNVLSAHRDYQTQKNKFGFDKVVLVCDIENIKRIYQHRYGPLVDFQGYINKFYSKTIFQFDNTQFIKYVLDNYLQNLAYHKVTRDYAKYDFVNNSQSGFYILVRTFLQIFLSYRFVSLRSLKNIEELKIKNRSFKGSVSGREKYIYDYDLLMLVEFLSVFFGSKSNLSEAIQKLAATTHNKEDFSALGIDTYDLSVVKKEFINEIINIVLVSEIEEKDRDTDYVFPIPNMDVSVKYRVERSGYYKYAYLISEPSLNEIIEGIDLIQFLKYALDIVEQRKYLS